MGIEEHGGARIDDVERFDHVLPLAPRLSQHTGDVFEIDLPARHRSRPLHGLMERLVTLKNALMAFQNAVNRLAGGNGQLKELQQRIALEVIADRLLTWHAAQAFGRLITNGEDLLHHQWMRWGGWELTRSRVALQDLFQPLASRQFFAKAFEPFFHPTLRKAKGGSQLGMRPLGMLLPDVIQIGAGGVV